mmetsp:Transcript_7286/g.8727  ORF Transcript_7286/g.8727 Transcript_7286/m.8727 type:complete len:212 (+) Transcript_7286:1040-1675(+)
MLAFLREMMAWSSSIARSFALPRGKIFFSLYELFRGSVELVSRMVISGSIILTRSSTTAEAWLFFESSFSSSSLISLTMISSSSSPLQSHRSSFCVCFWRSLNCCTKRAMRPYVTKQLSESTWSSLKAISYIFCMLWRLVSTLKNDFCSRISCRMKAAFMTVSSSRSLASCSMSEDKMNCFFSAILDEISSSKLESTMWSRRWITSATLRE